MNDELNVPSTTSSTTTTTTAPDCAIAGKAGLAVAGVLDYENGHIGAFIVGYSLYDDPEVVVLRKAQTAKRDAEIKAYAVAKFSK